MCFSSCFLPIHERTQCSAPEELIGTMASSRLLFLALLLTRFATGADFEELNSLIDLKSSLDPEDLHLGSWVVSGDPCGGTFEGVACNENGHVVNISLQGTGLAGKLSPAVGRLVHLTGLYLHYNSLYGEIPREIGNLFLLSDLYLNLNNLSGQIPSVLGRMQNLQVLQLCYNHLTGSIPTQLGSLKKLNVVALQHNMLTGAIPASLGDSKTLTRLDLSFNRLFGSIPTKLADANMLEILDVRNNSLSGNVPLALKGLADGFLYENNTGLCGSGFSSIPRCSDSLRSDPGRESTEGIPETADLNVNCTRSFCSTRPKKASSQASVAVAVMLASAAVSAVGVAASFAVYRRRKQKLVCAFDVTESNLSNDSNACEFYDKNGSPLVSLEYTNGWDPLSEDRRFGFSQEVMKSFRLNLQEVETATQYFAKKNFLGKTNYSETYRGTSRDGGMVVVKRIAKSCCRSEESEFLKGLNALASLRHENVVKLRGFCCSKGRGSCFLVYEFVPQGSLFRYLDLKDGNAHVLDWNTRVAIVKGVAKGIEYLHSYKANKPSLVHQNISSKNVLIDHNWNPLLSDSCLHKLLTDDTVFSSLKASAAMGYLAPEYTVTGRFTEKSDVYAFGVLVLQILTGKLNVPASARAGSLEFVDASLHGKVCEAEFAVLAKLAVRCTNVCPDERPSMESVVAELGH